MPAAHDPAPVPAGPVTPRPAATVVLLRPGPDGPEALLTRRPATMAFAADVFVFPGGAVDPEDDAVARARGIAGLEPFPAAAFAAAAREAREEVSVELDPADLVPLSRWVTPPSMPRRFDVRFFVAPVARDVAIRPDPAEVVEARWLRPADALVAMGRGEVGLWLPTSVTLDQLATARSIDDVRDRLAPVGPAGAPRVEEVAPAIRRVHVEGAGAVPGQASNGWLLGRRRVVVVDHGDPSEEAADVVAEALAATGSVLTAIVVTSSAPDHAAGAESLAMRFEVPILAGPGASSLLPHEVVELADGAAIDDADVGLRVMAIGAPRRDTIAVAVTTGEAAAVVVGDLAGPPPERALQAVVDPGRRRAALGRIAAEGPSLVLPGHGPALGPEALAS